MLSVLDELALEVHHLDRAREFYETHLDLEPGRNVDGPRHDSESHSDHEVHYDVGDTTLVLREPSPVPRGGVHVHYAFATTERHYETWFDRLDQAFDLAEFEFGSARSLYLDDPDGHCVEIGTGGQDGANPLTGIFEVVLEVEDLDRAEAFYRDLGFSVSDRGDGRERVRLAGPVDLELWEPQRGIADARGGVHVDLRFQAQDPTDAADAVADRACSVTDLEDRMRVRDPDGHYVTFTE